MSTRRSPSPASYDSYSTQNEDQKLLDKLFPELQQSPRNKTPKTPQKNQKAHSHTPVQKPYWSNNPDPVQAATIPQVHKAFNRKLHYEDIKENSYQQHPIKKQKRPEIQKPEEMIPEEFFNSESEEIEKPDPRKNSSKDRKLREPTPVKENRAPKSNLGRVIKFNPSGQFYADKMAARELEKVLGFGVDEVSAYQNPKNGEISIYTKKVTPLFFSKDSGEWSTADPYIQNRSFFSDALITAILGKSLLRAEQKQRK